MHPEIVFQPKVSLLLDTNGVLIAPAEVLAEANSRIDLLRYN